MILRRLFGWALAACALLAFSAPAMAAPADLTARASAYATDWPPGGMTISEAPAFAAVVREDQGAAETYAAPGPIGRQAHLFTASGRFALTHRTSRPGPS